MNAQQQDALRILTSRGPMTSRALFDIMQDELGYWSQAGTHDQQQAAIEALSKILSKLKAQGIIDGELTPQEKGRAVMTWSVPISNQHIDTSLISGQYDHPENDFGMMPEKPATTDDDPISNPAEMASDITELSASVDDFAIDLQSSSHLLILTDSKRILSGDNCEMKVQRATNQLHVCLSGNLELHSRAELAQFIGAIERMLP